MKSHLVLSAAIWFTLIGIAAPASAGHLPLVQLELNRHRLAWQVAGVVDYDFRFQRDCFCGPPFTQPGLVHVRSGRIVLVRHPDTGSALDPEIYLTVDELFDEAQQALDRDAIEVTLEYDPAMNYPTLLYIDVVRLLADEEIRYLAGDLKESPISSDLTHNGFVDFDDLAILLANWDQDDRLGNFGNLVNPDTTPINFDDLAVLLFEWTGPDPNPPVEAVLGAEAVPEPSGLVLSVVGLLGVCCSRRRRPLRRYTT